MSRTDKDMPWWVRAEWYEPWHYCGWRKKVVGYREVPESFGSGGIFHTDVIISLVKKAIWGYVYVGDCDLPDEPEVGDGVRGRYKSNKTRCEWHADWPRDYNYMSRGTRKKWRRHTEFHGPQRAAVRDAARRVKGGDWEAEFPDGRGRSSVLWDLW